MSAIYMSLPHDLIERQAFMMLFGKYDDIHKTAIWKNMQIAKKDADGFFSEKTGIVSHVFYQSYQENGKKKFVIVTKTIPIDVPFECHACQPLLSAAIFSRV